MHFGHVMTREIQADKKGILCTSPTDSTEIEGRGPQQGHYTKGFTPGMVARIANY